VSFPRKWEPSTPLPSWERPRVIPAQAGIQETNTWIPTFVGMTYKVPLTRLASGVAFGQPTLSRGGERG